jgi:hypothetical protein
MSVNPKGITMAMVASSKIERFRALKNTGK